MPSSYTTDLPNDILIDTAVLYYSNGDGTYARAGLAKDSTPEDFKTTRTARYEISGVKYTKAPTTGLSFTLAHVVTASKFGIVLVQINAAGTISTKVPASPQAYNTAALALAAKPAVDASNVELGYIEIENNAGDWTANTDDLTDGSDLTTADFTETIGGMAKFGGTRGGITFNRNDEWRNVPFDGASGETAGLDRKTGGVPTFEGTTIVFGPSVLPALEPGSATVTDGVDPNAIMTVTPIARRTMLSAATDYSRWECLWKRGNGGTLKVIFPLGRADFNSLGSQDNNEGEVPIVVRAVNDPDDIDGNDEVPSPYYYEVTGPDVTVA
jgi:hypothetical protein